MVIKMSELTEEELTEVWNAIIDRRIKIKLWIWLFDFKTYKEYLIVSAEYKGRELHYQERNDWGVILHSIEWKGEARIKSV